MPVHVAHEQRLLEVHPHRRVTADAEITVGAVGELQHRTVKGIEDRTHLRVGVRRHRPFAVLRRMTRGARRRRRIRALGKQLLVLFVGGELRLRLRRRVSSFLGFLGTPT